MEQTLPTKTPLSTIILERGLSPFDSNAAGLNLMSDVDQFFIEIKAQEHFIRQKRRIKKSLEKDQQSINKATQLPQGQAVPTATSEDPEHSSADPDLSSDEKEFAPFQKTSSKLSIRFSKKGKSSRFVVEHGHSALNMEED